MTLPLFDLNEWFAKAEHRFDLSLSHSGCEPQLVADLLDDADWESFRAVSLNYGAIDGLSELRTLIAGQYDSVDPEQVMTFNGPSEVIYTFMRAMLRPEDTVIVQSPMFQTLHSIARHTGCTVREWRATGECSCEFDVSDLAAICDPTTTLIVINFPHNPTGQTVTEADFRRIVDIAEAAGAMLFSDEAFRLLELPPHRTLPAACDLYNRAVSATGLSKPFGLGGLRIGWMATRCEEIRSAVKRYRYNTVEMTNTPCQWLACRALQRKEQVLARNRALISANLERLAALTANHDRLLKLFRPKAGTMAIVEQRTSLTSTEFCERILEEERVFLIPGRPLGMSEKVLRFGLGMSDFAAGLERLDRFLQRVDSR